MTRSLVLDRNLKASVLRCLSTKHSQIGRRKALGIGYSRIQHSSNGKRTLEQDFGAGEYLSFSCHDPNFAGIL